MAAEHGGPLQLLDDLELEPRKLLELYSENLVWSLFLTSTALHAIVLIASPIQAVIKWYRRRSSDSDTPLPYVCALMGSALWLRYSVFIGDLKLVLLQSYAVLMQLIFLLLLLFYRSKRIRLLRGMFFLFLGLTILFCYAAALPFEDGKRLIGFCAAGAQIAGSFVCPWLVYQAVTKQMIDFIPFAPVAFHLGLNCYSCTFNFNDVYDSQDGWCANDTLYTMPKKEVVRPCAPWETQCSTAIMTTLNSFTSITRGCAVSCSELCDAVGYGQDQVTCSTCCDSDLCNKGDERDLLYEG
ncbi:Sugar transporter SWEET [Aphelenchoides fujianensis]|nr:Sugar transporter SWEET [Aphelenchoides fujianensis]